MDYEQKYKRALERAREYLEAENFTEMADVFPELRESEDERIRKLLVWQVYRNIEDETNDLAQSVYDGIKGHDPDIEESIEDWKKCLAYLEKQKEQKPAQTSEEKEYIRTLKSLISDFIRDKQPEDVVFYQKIYDWLDGRHVEQKPAEWSEEDEKYLNRVINLWVNDFGEDSDTVKWLKSLKPSWKPSEEQMSMLLAVINDPNNAGAESCYMALNSIYNNLKKLM